MQAHSKLYGLLQQYVLNTDTPKARSISWVIPHRPFPLFILPPFYFHPLSLPFSHAGRKPIRCSASSQQAIVINQVNTGPIWEQSKVILRVILMRILTSEGVEVIYLE